MYMYMLDIQEIVLNTILKKQHTTTCTCTLYLASWDVLQLESAVDDGGCGLHEGVRDAILLKLRVVWLALLRLISREVPVALAPPALLEARC